MSVGDDGDSRGRGSSEPHPTASGGPQRPITDSLAKPLPKRFYEIVSVGEDNTILLDGRPVRTPKKQLLIAPTVALADAIASEWRSQDKTIDPITMPLTRFANTAIDAVAETKESVAADIVAYAGNDMLCYRAEAPVELVRQQASRWDPVLAWAARVLDARFLTVCGIMPIAQPPEALAAFRQALVPYDAFGLTGVHVLTTLTGSALLALAHARGAFDANATWVAAHVDEDYQISLWGEDFEAAERRKRRRAEFDAASTMLKLLAQ